MSDTEATLGGAIAEETTTEATTETAPVAESSPAVDFANEDMYRQFVDSLPDDVKGSQVIQETKDFSSLANQLLNAQSALGKKRLEAPSDDWDSDKWEEFYNAMRPEEGEYAIPDEVRLPEEFGDAQIPEFSDDALQELVDFAGGLGLNQQQFDVLYNRWAQMSVEGNQLVAQDQADTLKTFKTTMQAEWQDDFDVNLQNSKEAFTALSQEIPELNELISDPVVANHPATLKLFNKLSGLIKDTLPAAGSNPPNAFGSGTVQGIRNAIQELDESNSDLILSNPASLNLADRAKREEILAKRAKLYETMYGQS
jgi:hypothetical protein